MLRHLFQITMLSNHDLDNPKIKHYRHSIQETDWELMDMFEAMFNTDEMYEELEEGYRNISKKMYEEPAVKMLYAQRKDYDLIVLNDIFNSVRHDKNLMQRY